MCHSCWAAGSAGWWSGVSLMGLASMVAGAGVIRRLDWGGHPNGSFVHTSALPTFSTPQGVCVSLQQRSLGCPHGALGSWRQGVAQHDICPIHCGLGVCGDGGLGGHGAVPQESVWDGLCYHHRPWRCNLPQSGSSPGKSGPRTYLLTAM